MYLDNYKRWLAADLEDPALTEELKRIEGNDDEIKDRFAVSLQFGTAGLRGVLGAGSNRMNTKHMEMIMRKVSSKNAIRFAI